MQDKQVVELLGGLAREPQGQPRLDVAGAIRTGKRRTLRNRTAAAAAAAAAVLAVTAVVAAGVSISLPEQRPAQVAGPVLNPAPAKAPLAQVTSCTPEILPLPDGAASSSIAAMDPTGTYLVGKADETPAIWKDGVFEARIPAPGLNSRPVAVNSSGIAVGYGGLDSVDKESWAYAAGKVYPLKASAPVAVSGIDEAGRAAGTRIDGLRARAVVWESVMDPATDLPIPDGYVHSSAIGVFADGTVLGTVGTEKQLVRGLSIVQGDYYLWTPDHRGGTFLEGQDGKHAKMSVLRAGDGWLYGLTNGGAFARYEVATKRWSTFPTGLLQPENVNAQGWVVGEDDRTGKVFLYDGRKLITLPTAGSETANTVPAISADGSLLAGTLGTAAVWRCS
ncbi:hypothetical protein [Actinoplanes sp. NPDC051494]|uniref:hypothetical protein n=1 Tax=Actinoplanes sp. NPDC051494 TaxID=3363907 RepID=UPI0037BE0410